MLTTLLSSCAVVMKSGNLNFLEPSGPLQTCNGTALPLPFIHFYQRLSRPKGHSAVGRIMSRKNSNDTIGNRTRDLPVCSAVSQPTAPPRTPEVIPVTTLTAVFWWVSSCSVVIMKCLTNPKADVFELKIQRLQWLFFNIQFSTCNMGWDVEESWFKSRQKQQVFLPFKIVQTAIGLVQTPIMRRPGQFLHLVLSLRMHGAIPHSPTHFMA